MKFLVRRKQVIQVRLTQAQAEASLSYSKRLKVGAVLVKDGRVVANGRNGTPSGFDNECEIELDNGDLITKDSVTHAEMNVIGYAARAGVLTDGCMMVITHSPCYECSKLIISAGIKQVWYQEEYRDTSSFKLLKKAGVKIGKI